MLVRFGLDIRIFIFFHSVLFYRGRDSYLFTVYPLDIRYFWSLTVRWMSMQLDNISL